MQKTVVDFSFPESLSGSTDFLFICLFLMNFFVFLFIVLEDVLELSSRRWDECGQINWRITGSLRSCLGLGEEKTA